MWGDAHTACFQTPILNVAPCFGGAISRLRCLFVAAREGSQPTRISIVLREGLTAVNRSASLFIFLALSLTGCMQAVRITTPSPPPNPKIVEPLTTFKVEFAQYYVPGTFRAELDGKDVTQQFLPIAVAGGTSTMQMPDNQEGFRGGTVPNLGSQPNPLSVAGAGPGIEFAPASGGPGVPSGSGPIGTSAPSPNIAMHFHRLQVSGLCNGMVCDTTDEIVFLPIHLVGTPQTLNVTIGNRVQATVSAYPVMAMPVWVHVRPSSGSVRLNTEAPGVPILLQIPPGASVAFDVTGVVSGNLLLFIERRGMQVGSISGVVNP